MRKALVVFAVMSVAASAHALLGLELGVRGGYMGAANDWGDDTKPTGLLIGGQVVLGMVPVIDVEAAVEIKMPSEEYTFYDSLGVASDAKVELDNISFMVTAKYAFGLPGFVKPYIGAGLGYHNLSTTLSLDGAELPESQQPEDQNEIGIHGVGGVKLEIPMFPLKPFLEARYLSIQTEGQATDEWAVYVGVNLGF